MDYPRHVYAIYPYDESGEIAGVYVGSTSKLVKRINAHLTEKKGSQEELHDLMRENGFTFQILDYIRDYSDVHVEYDWVDFFEHTDIKVFNRKTKNKGYMVDIFQKDAYPRWNGKSVVMVMKPELEAI